MNNRIPPSRRLTPYDLEALLAARERLLAEFPEMADDETLLHDTLDGETNVLDVIDRLMLVSIEADTFAVALQKRKQDLTERLARVERRSKACRREVMAALEIAGLRRHERPEFSVSIHNGKASVHITDETRLPRTYIRVKEEPKLQEIGDALRNGEDVPGAVLTNGPDYLVVKTR